VKDLIKLLFVGDIMLGELLENHLCGVRSKIYSGVDSFEFCRGLFNSADITIGNLECILAPINNESCIFGNTNSDINCNLPNCIFKECSSPLEFIHILKNSGIKIFNLANNHTLDLGKDSLTNMINALDTNNIQYFGYSPELGIQTESKIISYNCIKFGFLGYNLANKKQSEILSLCDIINKAIENAKKDVNYLIVSVHWGNEYVNFPCEPQISIVKEFLKRGADIIYGHHSHQLQGFIFDDGKLVMFSM